MFYMHICAKPQRLVYSGWLTCDEAEWMAAYLTAHNGQLPMPPHVPSAAEAVGMMRTADLAALGNATSLRPKSRSARTAVSKASELLLHASPLLKAMLEGLNLEVAARKREAVVVRRANRPPFPPTWPKLDSATSRTAVLNIQVATAYRMHPIRPAMAFHKFVVGHACGKSRVADYRREVAFSGWLTAQEARLVRDAIVKCMTMLDKSSRNPEPKSPPSAQSRQPRWPVKSVDPLASQTRKKRIRAAVKAKKVPSHTYFPQMHHKLADGTPIPISVRRRAGVVPSDHGPMYLCHVLHPRTNKLIVYSWLTLAELDALIVHLIALDKHARR
ncbi:uncharacterized protein AMSG_01968 [Thecamonas trahens ATCC 50062]|uniref:Uncharacterized protein n=1 Tax=Thecamonas trahens ATCC 50062 TaxID=461836 RepID=A0A0L0DUG9_THETB|nr:hypothetical protein AMSG_01968 [Thecamonas trahens ATCC 50062]KNC55701.1 hypothetical protein AMSG_01968 [Thecamonas trahens ATCC 50062]|eukprot:XP_013761465.1 hypothetical protein AMSG_01968 [Thecamonas trahens ATCC 50062]